MLLPIKRGATITEIITGLPINAGSTPDLIIYPGWPYGDALIAVPQHVTEILSASGIVQTAIYWAILCTPSLSHTTDDNARCTVNSLLQCAGTDVLARHSY